MLRIGDKVKVRVPADKTGDTVRKLNGTVTAVSKASGWKNGQIYYELAGITSDRGVPYAFVEDWLMTVED